MRVLIIDDDALVRRAWVKILKSRGWEVVTAADPGEAVDYYDQADVVISDWHMPYGGGARVLKDSTKPVIICSATPPDTAKCAAILTKPASVDKMHETLMKVLAEQDIDESVVDTFESGLCIAGVLS